MFSFMKNSGEVKDLKYEIRMLKDRISKIESDKKEVQLKLEDAEIELSKKVLENHQLNREISHLQIYAESIIRECSEEKEHLNNEISKLKYKHENGNSKKED